MTHAKRLLVAALCAAALAGPGRASDHGDTPPLIAAGRQDALISDLHAFTRGGNLVLAVCMNTAIPPSATSYQFPSDLTVDILLDTNSRVTFSDAEDLATFGGTIRHPRTLREDVRFRLTFDETGAPDLDIRGLPRRACRAVRLYTGLRDDPFIRGPRNGRNVAAIVIEVPLGAVVRGHHALLIWCTSKVENFDGPFQDLAGRSLRSMFPENDEFNRMHPRDHWRVLGQVPDVIIHDTSRPAAFPNGRELADDVVDLVGDPRVLMNDAPFPSANDVPFLNVFPYLAPPHPAP